MRDVPDELDRRGVGPADVIEPDQTGNRPGRKSRDHIGERLEQAGLAVRVRRRRWRNSHRDCRERDEARCLTEEVASHRPQARLCARPGEAGPDELHDRGERNARLARVGACRENRSAGGTDGVGEGVPEPRLADPRLALDEEEPAVRSRGPVCFDERGQLRLPADERNRGRDVRRHRDEGRDADRRARRWRARQAARADLLGQPRRLGERRHAQLPVESPHAVPVLGERSRGFAGPGQDFHEQPVRGFMERVELEPSARRRSRRGPDPGRRLAAGQPFEDRRQLTAVRCALRQLPLLELLRVAQREPGHELAAVQRDRRPERVNACRAEVAARVRVAPRDREGLVEAPDVDIECRRVEPDRRTIDDKAPVVESGAQHRQRSTKRAPGAGAVSLGPEQRRDELPARRATGHGEVREECHGLAGIHGQRRTADLDRHRPEQADPDLLRRVGRRPGRARHRTSRYSVRDAFRNGSRHPARRAPSGARRDGFARRECRNVPRTVPRRMSS